MTREMEQIFPLFSLEEDWMISKTGDFTQGFRLELPPLFTLDLIQLTELHSIFLKAFRLLPIGTIVWKQDWFEKGNWTPEVGKCDASFLSRCSEVFFREKVLWNQSAYLFFTFPSQEKPLRNSSFSNLLRKHWLGVEDLDKKLPNQYAEIVAQIHHLICSGGIKMDKLDDLDWLGNLNSLGILGNYLMPGSSGKNGRLELSDMEFRPDWRTADQFFGMLSFNSLDQFSESLSLSNAYEPYSSDQGKFHVGYTSSLGPLFPRNHIYSQVFQILDSQHSFSELEAKRLRMHALSKYSRANEMGADSIGEFLKTAIGAGHSVVKAHAHILLWETQKEELEKSLREGAAAISKLGWIPKRESIGAPMIYWAGLPGNATALPANECFTLSLDRALCLFNWEGKTKGDESGIRLGDRKYGTPLWVDLSDAPMKKGWISNRNKFILGPSGSGKSFFTNHMVRSYYESGTHVVLVDVGHSYKGLCDLVGGYYFTYSETNPICFNPFYLGKEQLDTEKKESLKTLLLSLWKKEDESFKRSEYVALSNAVTSYFEYLSVTPEIKPDFNSFYEFLQADFSKELESQNVQLREFDLHNFLFVLRPFYRGGEFDYLLNGSENLDLLDQRFIVFELDTIKDHPILFHVVTLIIMEIFISKMRRLKGIRKMILIEEAWKAIAKEGMAEYIKYLFKTVRKFFGEAVVVTQEVEDIIHSPIIKEAIINNSDCKILLDQRKYQNKFDGIQALLGLTEKERIQILSMNRANDPNCQYKEVFIGLGSHSQVYRTEVSLEEYLTYTTEEKEKVALETRLKKSDGGLETAIASLAKEIRERNR